MAAINPVAAEALKNYPDSELTTKIQKNNHQVSTSAIDLLAQEKRLGNREKRRLLKDTATHRGNFVNKASDLVAQGVTRVTGVEVS